MSNNIFYVKSLKNQSGIALIMVVMMISALSVLSLDVTSRARNAASYANGIDKKNDFYWLNNVLLDFAFSKANQINAIKENTEMLKQAFSQFSRKKPFSMNIPGSDLEVSLFVDIISNKFNINSLIKELSDANKPYNEKTIKDIPNTTFFYSLLTLSGIDLDTIKIMINSLSNFFIKNNQHVIEDISVIRSLEGFGFSHFNFLKQFLIAIPDSKENKFFFDFLDPSNGSDNTLILSAIFNFCFSGDKKNTFSELERASSNCNIPDKTEKQSMLKMFFQEYEGKTHIHKIQDISVRFNTGVVIDASSTPYGVSKAVKCPSLLSLNVTLKEKDAYSRSYFYVKMSGSNPSVFYKNFVSED